MSGRDSLWIAAGLVCVAVATTRAAQPSSAPASTADTETLSVANTPTTLAPRRAPRTLNDLEIVKRHGTTVAWYRSLPVALGSVLAVISVCALAAKKYFPSARAGGSGGGLDIVARAHLSPRQSICLVRAGRRLVMVGVTSDRITALADFDDPEAVSRLVGQAETRKAHSSTVAFEGIVQDASAAYVGRSGPAPVERPEEEDESYAETRGHLNRLLSRVRAYTEDRRAG